MQRVEGFVEIDAPVELVFDRFSDFEDFPRWMRNICEVRRTGRTTAHWVSETAMPDVFAEWDAVVTHYEPDRRIAWRSVRGDIHADGEAVFTSTREGTTIVRVVLGFDTPLGRSGAQASRFFGVRLDKQLDKDIDQFRRLVERDWGARKRQRRTASERGFAPVMSARSKQRRRVDEENKRPRREQREEEYIPRYALTPREREREHADVRREFDPRVSQIFKRRGVDRLMDDAQGRGWDDRRRD